MLMKISLDIGQADSNDEKIQWIDDDNYYEILMNSTAQYLPTESAQPVMQKYIAPKYGREGEELILQHGRTKGAP